MAAPDASSFAWAAIESYTFQLWIGGNIGKLAEKTARKLERDLMNEGVKLPEL